METLIFIFAILFFLSFGAFLYFLSWKILYNKVRRIKKSGDLKLQSEKLRLLYKKIKLKSKKNYILFEIASNHLINKEQDKAKDISMLITKSVFIDEKAYSDMIDKIRGEV